MGRIALFLLRLFELHREEISFKGISDMGVRNISGINRPAGGILKRNRLAFGEIEDGLSFLFGIDIGVIAIYGNAFAGLNHIAVCEAVIVAAVGKDIAAKRDIACGHIGDGNGVIGPCMEGRDIKRIHRSILHVKCDIDEPALDILAGNRKARSSNLCAVHLPVIECFSESVYGGPEMKPLLGQCKFGASCSHLHEPGCKILEAVYAGVIFEDRYESWKRITNEIKTGDFDE